MNKHTRAMLGALFIAAGVFLPNAAELVAPRVPIARDVLKIEKPSDEYVENSKVLAELVTDVDDRNSLSVFTHEFSKRIPSYETNGQVYNDILVHAAKSVYADSMKGKYDGLSEHFTSNIKDTLGEYDVIVNKEKKEELSLKFLSDSWVLGGK